MKPIFTIHAGEYLVASQIEKKFKTLNVWIPGKDTGIDLLVTDHANRKTATIQVKMSRDYRPPEASNDFQRKLAGTGWVRIGHESLDRSEADIWSIVIVSPQRSDSPIYLHIPPRDLLARLVKIHGKRSEYHFYPWVTKDNKCLHGREMNKKQVQDYLEGSFVLGPRDLSDYLENWSFLKKLF